MAGQLLARPATTKDGQHDIAPGAADRSTLSAAPAELRTAGLDDLLAASFAQLPAESDYEASARRRSINILLRWLSRFPGDTWQARWSPAATTRAGRPSPMSTSMTGAVGCLRAPAR